MQKYESGSNAVQIAFRRSVRVWSFYSSALRYVFASSPTSWCMQGRVALLSCIGAGASQPGEWVLVANPPPQAPGGDIISPGIALIPPGERAYCDEALGSSSSSSLQVGCFFMILQRSLLTFSHLPLRCGPHSRTDSLGFTSS